MDVQKLLLLLDQMRLETLAKIINPAEGLKTEFGYGRISGILFAIEKLREMVNEDQEERARREEQFERES